VITTLLLTSSVVCGCKSRPVYVGAGQIVEIAKPAKFTGWVTNKETGKRELRTVEAHPGWFVGRPKGTHDGERN